MGPFDVVMMLLRFLEVGSLFSIAYSLRQYLKGR
jgi:hypothetical protein